MIDIARLLADKRMAEAICEFAEAELGRGWKAEPGYRYIRLFDAELKLRYMVSIVDDPEENIWMGTVFTVTEKKNIYRDKTTFPVGVA